MKWYMYILIAVVLFGIFLFARSPAPLYEEQIQPTTFVVAELMGGQTAPSSPCVDTMMRSYDVFSGATIVVNKGEVVQLFFSSSVSDMISIPELGVYEKLSPGNIVEFTATKTGIFAIDCNACSLDAQIIVH